MANLTEKELSALSDLLSSATDPAIKSKLSSIADMHQRHFNALCQHLN